MKSNVVHPEDMRPGRNTKGIHHGGSQFPFTFGPAKNFTDKSFTRGGEQYGAVHTRKGIEVSYYVEIMRNSLAKPYARIDYYLDSALSRFGRQTSSALPETL